MLKTAVIGLGVGAQHALAYEEHPECELIQVCDLDPNKRDWAKEKFPNVVTYAKAEQILECPEVDVVSIASHDQDHAQQVLLGLNHGKHLFVEKPLCLLKRDAQNIADYLNKSPDLKISSNLILREYPVFKQLKKLIRSGRFGEIFSVEADYNYGRLHKILEGWRSKTPDYSITLGGSVHLIDVIQWIFGSQPTRVCSMANKVCSQDSSFKYPDFITSLLDWNGMIVKVTANFGCVQPHFHNIKIYGTKGTFSHGLKGTFISSSRDPEAPLEKLKIPYPGCNKGDLIASFIDSIKGRKNQAVTKDDLFNTLSICLAIDQSYQSSTSMAIDYLK